MKKYNLLNMVIAIFIAGAVGLGCSSGGEQKQTAEANKIIDETNKKIDEAKKLFTDTEDRNTRLFSARIATLRDLQRYRKEKWVEARSIIGDYEICAELLKHISGQYETVSRMKLDDKYLHYAKVKADEYSARAEAVTVRKGAAQAFLEIENPDKLLARLDDTKLKYQKLSSEADALGDKANKLQEENREIFNQL